MYIPLRSFCRGWHSDKIWKCTVISNVILLLQVYGIENIKMHLSMSGMLLIIFSNMVCVYFISPVGTEMKKISQAEKKTYKRKIKFIVFFNVIIAIINVLSGAYEFVFSLMFVYNTKCNGVNGNNKKYKVLF
ncbi:accessory gene regulator B family protein [Clostridium perfringens]